jgi:hypothetical protein
MAYFDISLLAQDQDFLLRVAACYSTETLGDADAIFPTEWSAQHLWEIASAPGFGDAYASALAGGVPNPGRDPSVINDTQILAAVQTVLTPTP